MGGGEQADKKSQMHHSMRKGVAATQRVRCQQVYNIFGDCIEETMTWTSATVLMDWKEEQQEPYREMVPQM